MRYGVTELPQSIGKFSESIGVNMMTVQHFLADLGYLERNAENKFVPTLEGIESMVVDEYEMEMDTKNGRENVRFTRILEAGKDMFLDHFELESIPSTNTAVNNSRLLSKIDEIYRYIKTNGRPSETLPPPVEAKKDGRDASGGLPY